MQILEIGTARLLLRQWRDDDLGQLIEMNADPKVMEFIGPTLNEDQSKAMMERARKSWDEHGYGRFAVEVLATGSVIGFVGLAPTRIDAHFAPAVEIGWRLSTQYWGHGYATEGAKAVKDYAFENLGLQEIVSFTSTQNLRSRHVMEKIGLSRNPSDDFEHPNASLSETLRANVLYRGFAISKTS
ncbi:MAG: GNAT family N-acetyltransferase [Candidatus Nanopelagicaceae bacterium]|nr:GNAT family N-acetyltransferase [Candidatus Nanopelagicaceae bacterium]